MRLIPISLAALATTACAYFPAAPEPSSTPLPSFPDAPRLIATALTDQPITFSTQADERWLDEVADATRIPRRALAAYAGAEIATAQSRPGCGIRWATLAAVGYVESRHGEIFGGAIEGTGVASPPVYGVALDGAEFDAIPDTDRGAIDGDTEWDRAVGPMQLLPEAWRNWHVDANADGVEDPQNIDDASVAAANYLCRAAGELTTRDGWRSAIRSYNGADSYLTAVIAAAQAYAEKSRASG